MFLWNFLIKKMYRKDLSISLTSHEKNKNIETCFLTFACFASYVDNGVLMNESYMTDKITGVFERFKKSTFRTLSVYKF